MLPKCARVTCASVAACCLMIVGSFGDFTAGGLRTDDPTWWPPCATFNDLSTCRNNSARDDVNFCAWNLVNNTCTGITCQIMDGGSEGGTPLRHFDNGAMWYEACNKRALCSFLAPIIAALGLLPTLALCAAHHAALGSMLVFGVSIASTLAVGLAFADLLTPPQSSSRVVALIWLEAMPFLPYLFVSFFESLFMYQLEQIYWPMFLVVHTTLIVTLNGASALTPALDLTLHLCLFSTAVVCQWGFVCGTRRGLWQEDFRGVRRERLRACCVHPDQRDGKTFVPEEHGYRPWSPHCSVWRFLHTLACIGALLATNQRWLTTETLLFCFYSTHDMRYQLPRACQRDSSAASIFVTFAMGTLCIVNALLPEPLVLFLTEFILAFNFATCATHGGALRCACATRPGRQHEEEILLLPQNP